MLEAFITSASTTALGTALLSLLFSSAYMPSSEPQITQTDYQ